MSDALLTNNERAEYLRRKFEMRNGFEQAIRAVEAIRDQRLYRVEYSTFEDFCQKELAHTRQHINRLIKSIHIFEDLEPIGSISNEAQTRELAGLNAEQQRDALIVAKVTAPEGKVTAAWLKSTVEVLKATGATGGYVDVGDGGMTPLAAAITHETYERSQRQQEHIKAGRPKPITVQELTIKVLSGIEQLAESLANLDESEIVRVVIYPVANHE